MLGFLHSHSDGILTTLVVLAAFSNLAAAHWSLKGTWALGRCLGRWSAMDFMALTAWFLALIALERLA